jgi:hypothetical protein
LVPSDLCNVGLTPLLFVCPVVGVRQTSGKCTAAFAQRIGGPIAV